MATVILSYQPPYDWPAVLAFLGARRIPTVESIEDGCYGRSVRLGSAQGWFRLAHDAQRNSFELTYALSDEALAPALIARVRRLLDLDAALGDVHAVLARDPLLAELIAQFPGTRLPGTWDPFEFSIRAVLGQQISVRAATTLATRIATRYGLATPAGPADLSRFFPSAAELADVDFSGLGLTRARTATLVQLVAAVNGGRVDFSHDRPQAFEQAFVALPGIGPWTAQYVAMRGLSLADAFPASDLGVLKALGNDGRKATPRAAAARADAWRPWRAYATILLWRSLS